MFQLLDSYGQNAVIKVIGIGGCGGNAVQHMTTANIEGVDFICANTDAQALGSVDKAVAVLQLGEETRKGLGAGTKPEIGMQAALDDMDRIKEAIEGSDMLFITAGMGGGTGTGAAPVVAQAAKEMGILTVAVVTKPFGFEGNKRMNVAEDGIKALEGKVDSLIIIPNAKLVPVLGEDTTLLDAFKEANDILLGAVRGIAELITRQGLINVDFADVRTVMSEMGMAMMGSSCAKGQGRAKQAVDSAIASPLLENIDLLNVGGILVNVTAGLDLSIGEFDEVCSTIKECASENATVVVGTVIEPEMSDELRVTVVATGIGESTTVEAVPDENIRLIYGCKGKNIVPETMSVVSSADDHEAAETAGAESETEKNFAYLDVPAFLRKQAD